MTGKLTPEQRERALCGILLLTEAGVLDWKSNPEIGGTTAGAQFFVHFATDEHGREVGILSITPSRAVICIGPDAQDYGSKLRDYIIKKERDTSEMAAAGKRQAPPPQIKFQIEDDDEEEESNA